jgi:hypothetical protein
MVPESNEVLFFLFIGPVIDRHRFGARNYDTWKIAFNQMGH